MWRNKSKNDNGDPGGKPPFLSSWPTVYGVVLGILAALITLFHLFTVYFR